MAPWTRRDFVERALSATAAALAAGHGASAAEADRAPSSRRTAPSEKIGVAVIGVHGQGGEHLTQWIDNPDVELIAVCDCDPNAYAQHERRLAALPRRPVYVKDVRKLLENQAIDAVSIATPNHTHALLAVWAMQAGKDVYVEKPCSHNVREGRLMTQWARKLGRMCQMGVQSRSMTGMRQTLEFIRSGKIGAVKAAHALCYRRRDSIGLSSTPAPVPPGLDLNLWCGPAPLEVPVRRRFHYDWHWTRVTGNGDLGNQNPHELDKARWALGKQELPRRVLSLGGRLGYIDNGDVANSQVTLFEWDDALLISDVRGLPIRTDVALGLPQGGPFEGACNIWYGEEGYAVGPDYDAGVAFDYDGNQLGRWSGGAYQAHFANFIQAVRSRDHRDLHLDIEDGHLSSALAHLGNVSWTLGVDATLDDLAPLADRHPLVERTLDSFAAYVRENRVDLSQTRLQRGRPLTIDPQTELADDPEANRLFTRDYRRGFEMPVV